MVRVVLCLNFKFKHMENGNYLSLSPSIGGSFSNGWKKTFDWFFPLFVLIIVSGILTGPVGLTSKADRFSVGLIFPVMIGLAYAVFFVPVITYGEKWLFLKSVRDKKFEIAELFDGFRNQYLNIVLANLIVFALVGVGFIMLIIPGIIIACRLSFVPYIVMDQKLEPMAALERSWKMTSGHGWTIFFMAILSFFIIIAGIMALIFGVFISIIWIHSAFATLYQSVLNEEIRKETIPIISEA